MDFLDVVWLLMEAPGEKNWEGFAIMAWSLLWNNRNSAWHGGVCKRGKTIAGEAQKYEDEVRASMPVQRNGTPPAPRIKQWTPPPRGKYKINTDAAVFQDLGCCGVGVVIRNDNGQMMGAMCKRVGFPLGALEAEAKALEAGLLFAWDLGLKDRVVESDSLSVIKP
ncbi:uncharacterized protein LOC112027137 [Quercus suber]|uniref:uncharacterized protein LOC112027137 n=1 Tax=Quercus suber TaxID=58331 RepID=UPI000CE24538|nr:uncharacterized protein LOC112027137 [Quercus suber]